MSAHWSLQRNYLLNSLFELQMPACLSSPHLAQVRLEVRPLAAGLLMLTRDVHADGDAAEKLHLQRPILNLSSSVQVRLEVRPLVVGTLALTGCSRSDLYFRRPNLNLSSSVQVRLGVRPLVAGTLPLMGMQQKRLILLASDSK